jgi:asparagine synthase (glutamine-hydrolysing)
VNRLLVGVFDPHRRIDSSRLTSALGPCASAVLDLGPLRVAYSGPEPQGREPLCLLDGFLDNAAELGDALGAPEGCSWEALLAAGWRRWGDQLLPRLRGDFALLLWDTERGRGLLARDQLGVRSLFLHRRPDGLCFAGEIRDLLALLPTRPSPDPVSLAHWLATSSRPGSATLYRGICRLNPGAALMLDRDRMREHVYWAPVFDEPVAQAEPQLAREVRAALERAVRRRIGPHADTGVLMSGGLDSASIAAAAATRAPGRVRAYAGVFPDHPAVDESELIAELRRALRLDGVTAKVRPGGLLASALAHQREWQLPLLGWGDFWMLPLLHAARAQGIETMLGGDGGDELFGSRSYLLADRLRQGHPLQALRLARELPGAAYGPSRRELARMVAKAGVAGALPYRLHRLLRAPRARAQAPTWLRRQTRRDLLESEDPLAWKRMDGPRWWAGAAHDVTRKIEEIGVFEHQRRQAAAAGLQARHPLFDLELIELGLRQPPLATFDRYRSRPVLRAAVAGLLPDSVRLRPQKALFDSVIVDTLAGPDGEGVRQLLGDPAAELGSYLDLREVRRELLESDRRRHEQPFQWMWQVWRLATAECWLRFQHGADAPPLAGLRASTADVTLASAETGVYGASYVFPT